MIRFTLRLDNKLHKALRKRAQGNMRSLHGELIHILTEAAHKDSNKAKGK